MFEQSLVTRDEGRRRPAAVAFSLALQTAAVGALAIVPLWRSAALPSASAEAAVVAPPALAAPARPASRALATQTMVRLAAAEAPALIAPTAIPRLAAARAAMQPLAGAVLGAGVGVPGGAESGLVDWLGRPKGAAPAPPPGAAGTIRVGGEVQAERCVACPPPRYPALARMAGVSGVVVLAAVIGRDGRVEALRVVRGPALLASAALRAVRRWRYRPTRLNAMPVSVRTAIRVAFRLRGR